VQNYIKLSSITNAHQHKPSSDVNRSPRAYLELKEEEGIRLISRDTVRVCGERVSITVMRKSRNNLQLYDE